MKRCSLYWVLSLFVFAVTLLCCNLSSCLALSYEDIKEYVNDTADYYSSNSNYQQIKQKINSVNASDISNINNMANGYNNVCIFKLDNTHFNLKVFNATKLSSDTSSITYTGNYKLMQWNGSWSSIYGPYNETNSSIDGGYSYKGTTGQENSLWGMTLLGQTPTGQLPNTFVGDQAIPKFTFLEFINDVENSAYNGNTFTYYIQGDFYSVDKIKIGSIVPNDSYYYESRLKDSVNGIVKGTSFVALNTSPNTYYNDGALIIDNTGVYIMPRLLKYSQQYQLEITSYYGDGGDNLYEDIDWFIFLPFNAVVSGDHILSLGSGDYTTQDSTNDIMGFLGNYTFPSGDIEGILNSNGSLLSGDLIEGINIPVLDGMKNYTLFDLLRAIGDCVGGSGDAYFDFQMHGETPTRIYASQFRTPDGALKTLISSFLVFFTFYFLLLQIRHVLEMLTTANIKGAIDYVDSSLDNMFYM